MSKSRLFLTSSLIFLLANFLYVVLDEPIYNQSFAYDDFYTFEARVVKLDKKINGWNLVFKPLSLEHFSGNVLAYLPLYPYPFITASGLILATRLDMPAS